MSFEAILVWVRLATVMALLLAGAACGDDADSSTPSSRPSVSESCDVDLGGKELDDLEARVAETVARRTAAFEAEVETRLSVEGQTLDVHTSRTGAFSDETFEGSGTLSFAADDAALAESLQLPDQPFAFRLVEGTFWFFNPVPDEPGWLGSDVLEFGESLGGDPTGSIDGDAWITLVVDSATSVEDVTVDPETCKTVWTIKFSADEVAPLMTTGGELQRLSANGVDTGKAGSGTVVVDAAGMVATMELDFDDWIQTATEELGGAGSGAAVRMRVSFSLGAFDEPVTVEAPCASPVDYVEAGQPAGLLCPGA